MAGIMEELNNIRGVDDATVIGNPAIESEIVMMALQQSCDSDKEYATLLENAGTEMALFGVIDNADVATEVVKKIQVTDWKTANYNRIVNRTAIRLAMVNNDALYTKYRMYRDRLIEIRKKIYTKYEAKARTEARKIIKNSRNKAANMNSAAGKTITEKMDQQIAAADKATK